MKEKLFVGFVIALMIMGIVPFLPPIYNRYTRPFYKNYVDRKNGTARWIARIFLR